MPEDGIFASNNQENNLSCPVDEQWSIAPIL
jgi:hypothetical protein